MKAPERTLRDFGSMEFLVSVAARSRFENSEDPLKMLLGLGHPLMLGSCLEGGEGFLFEIDKATEE